MSPITGLLPGRPTESLRSRLRRDRHDPAGRTSQIHRNPRTTLDTIEAEPRRADHPPGRLDPVVDESGETRRRGKLAKAGSPHLRWALVEAAVHANRQS